MKSFVRIFGVVAGMAALLASCNKQEEVFVPEGKTVEMTIVASSDETKTVLGSDGTVTWSEAGENEQCVLSTIDYELGAYREYISEDNESYFVSEEDYQQVSNEALYL